MGNLMKVIRNQDQDAHKVSIYFSGKSEYKSKTGGLISILYFLIMLVIVYFKASDLFNKNHINLKTEIVKNDFSILEVAPETMRFQIQVATARKVVTIDNLLQYGVNITIQKHYISETKETLQQIQLIACQNKNFFCIPQDYNFSLFGRTDITLEGNQYQGLAIKLKTCYKSVDPNCQPYQNNLMLFLVLKNNVILPYEKDIGNVISYQSRFFQLHGKLIISQSIGKEFDLKKVVFYSDPSLFPQIIHQEDHVKEKVTWFYDEETSQEIYVNPDPSTQQNDLMKIFFKRSLYTYNYTRSYQKIDSMLAQIFGLAGLLSLFMFGIYKGYNKWSYDQWKLKLYGKNNLQTNIFSYYCSVLRCKTTTDEQIEKNTDIFYLHKRIEQLEEIIKMQYRVREEQISRVEKKKEEEEQVEILNEDADDIGLKRELIPQRNTIN